MEQHLYLALCTENGGVWHCVLKDGRLDFREFTALSCPMYLAFEPDTEKGSVGRLHILLRNPWAENGVFDSGIVTCSVAEDGSLGVPGEPQSTHGLVGCYLCSWKGRLYAANYTSGSIARVPDLLIQHEGHGVDPARQERRIRIISRRRRTENISLSATWDWTKFSCMMKISVRFPTYRCLPETVRGISHFRRTERMRTARASFPRRF